MTIGYSATSNRNEDNCFEHEPEDRCPVDGVPCEDQGTDADCDACLSHRWACRIRLEMAEQERDEARDERDALVAYAADLED